MRIGGCEYGGPPGTPVICVRSLSLRKLLRFANRAGQRPQLLIAPSLSEVLVQRCRAHGISCRPEGRQWIRAEGLVAGCLRNQRSWPVDGQRARCETRAPGGVRQGRWGWGTPLKETTTTGRDRCCQSRSLWSSPLLVLLTS